MKIEDLKKTWAYIECENLKQKKSVMSLLDRSGYKQIGFKKIKAFLSLKVAYTQYVECSETHLFDHPTIPAADFISANKQ